MNPELALIDTAQKLGLPLGPGLLVGLQRERTGSPIAGIRTFPLTTVLGTVTGFLARIAALFSLALLAGALILRLWP
jgi:hypothetical protein